MTDTSSRSDPTILGVHFGHDAAAALVQHGRVVAHSAEERFNRVKHYGGAPAQAIDYCLRWAGVKMKDVDVIATTSPLEIPSFVRSFAATFHLSEERVNQLVPPPSPTYLDALRKGARALGVLPPLAEEPPMIPPSYILTHEVRDRTEIVRVDHHLAHASNAYHTSGFDRCLVITSDGVGDDTSLAVWRGAGGKLDRIRSFGPQGSFGWFFGIVTEALGWQVGDGEGKTMGLAPYGDADSFDDQLLLPWLPRYANGELVKPVDFGPIGNYRLLDTDNWHFLGVEPIVRLVEQHGPENVAAKAQRLLEEEMVAFIAHWLRAEGVRRLAASGGVFLNVKVNQEIVERGLVDEFHVFPDAGDAGLPVGSALAVWQERRPSAVQPRITGVYWGPSYSNDEIETIFKIRNLPYRRCDDIAAEAASLLAAGKIVGWFQGRAESGPRALGARSILMDPRDPGHKDIINARVKYREAFRPFCPSMTEEAANRYLTQMHRDRYMVCASSVRETAAADLPAVVHVDGTVRPQVVTAEFGRYHDLIARFGEFTGVPVVLNTSFNIKGEPIVSTPSEAIRCFYDTGLDALAIEDFLLTKSA